MDGIGLGNSIKHGVPELVISRMDPVSSEFVILLRSIWSIGLPTKACAMIAHQMPTRLIVVGELIRVKSDVFFSFT